MSKPIPPIDWTPVQDAQLERWRAEGVSYKECGEKFDPHISSGAVARRCKILGLPIVNHPPSSAAPKSAEERPAKKPQPQPLKADAVTLPLLPSLHHPLPGYVACAPNGTACPSTLRSTPDDAWRALRASITEPDTLIDKGWHICRCLVMLAERLEEDAYHADRSPAETAA